MPPFIPVGLFPSQCTRRYKVSFQLPEVLGGRWTEQPIKKAMLFKLLQVPETTGIQKMAQVRNVKK